MKRRTLIMMVMAFLCCMMVTMNVSAAKEIKVKNITLKKYEKTVTISKGERLALKVRVAPSKAKNKKLKWKSNKKKVVSVTNKGVIRGRKKGTAKITATTTDGSNKKITLKVTVGTKVSGIKFTNASELTELKVGSTYKLNVDVQPSNASNKKLRWTSSNENVATVNSSGKVKGIGNGTAVITAKTTDGTNKKISKVVKVVTYVKSITLNTESNSVYWQEIKGRGIFLMTGKSVKIDAEISPSGASDKALSWSSGNPEVATVSDNGMITAVGNGIAIITVQAMDKGQKKKTYYVYSSALERGECTYIAHRGRCDMAPDNSMAAFKLGLESGYDAIELDIWPTKDNEFVVSHNESLESATGYKVNVTDLTLEQATAYRITIGKNVEQYQNEYIPSLNQVLELAQHYPTKRLSVELKTVFTQEQLIKLLKELEKRGLTERVKLITFCPDNLKRIRDLKEMGGDTIALEYLTDSPSGNTIALCKQYSADLGAKYVGVTETQVRQMHSLGLKVNVWTVRNYLDAYHMVNSLKVDALTTDYMFFR